MADDLRNKQKKGWISKEALEELETWNPEDVRTDMHDFMESAIKNPDNDQNTIARLWHLFRTITE